MRSFKVPIAGCKWKKHCFRRRSSIGAPFQLFLLWRPRQLAICDLKHVKTAPVPIARIENRIRVICGHKVMIDVDLAELCGVETRALIQAVKRNLERFPAEFMFQLNAEESEALRSQTVISKPGRGGRRYAPYAFTEHGAIQASNVLNSPARHRSNQRRQ